MSVVAASEEDVKAGEHMLLADVRFRLGLPDAAVSPQEKEELKANLIAGITKYEMTPYYDVCCEEFKWTPDAELRATMSAANEAETARVAEQLAKAKESGGEIEIMDAIVARADFLFRIGLKDEAVNAAKSALGDKSALTLSTGQKIDLIMKIIRVALFHADVDLLKEHIAEAKVLIEDGGDWDRRNRLKVYEGSYQMLTRDFEGAADNFLNSIATFTCYEIMSYNTFIARTVLLTMHTLERALLKKKIIDSPDVLTVIRELPDIQNFLNSLYRCDYRQYMVSMIPASEFVSRDRFISSHLSHYVKEMRVRGYKQFLESYKSVTMASMAASFGMSVEFLDRELYRFISKGRLNVKIDKIEGVVETNRKNAKNVQYQEVIKRGDALLNQIQKLARVVNV